MQVAGVWITAADVIFLCVAMSGAFLANIFLTMMIGEINRKRDDGNLVSYFGFTLPKLVRIWQAYRDYYPNGRLHLYAALSTVSMFAGVFGMLMSLGIF
ncbi:MAG: hypothetical protein WBX15_11150 [Thermoanaerobaculia bacterium]